MRVLRLGGRRWAVGLWWMSIEGDTGVDAATRRRLFDDVAGRYNAYAERPMPVPQLGFAAAGTRVRRHSALAPVLAEAWGGTWLARFHLGVGVWVVAVVQGVIHPDGDCFTTDAAGAERHYQRLADDANIDAWDETTIYTDAAEAGAKLAEALAAARTRVRLRPRYFQLEPAHAAAAVAGVLMLAAWAIDDYNERWQARHRAIERALIAEMRQRALDRLEPPRPWNAEPRPTRVLARCAEAVRRAPLVARGWRLERWSCSPDEIDARWRRGVGAGYDARRRPRGAALAADDPDVATATRELSLAGARDKQALGERDAGAAELYELTRRFGEAVEIEWSTVTLGPADGPPERRARYHRASWRVEVPMAPFFGLGSALDRIPGLVVESIRHRRDEPWAIEGVLYAKT